MYTIEDQKVKVNTSIHLLDTSGRHKIVWCSLPLSPLLVLSAKKLQRQNSNEKKSLNSILSAINKVPSHEEIVRIFLKQILSHSHTLKLHYRKIFLYQLFEV
jgi:hypothetical protein